jgi:acyl-CoA synthetase (NDP forming)
MGVLFEQLLEYIRERVLATVGASDDKNSLDDQFVDLLLKIFETKIFPIHKVNFMQYLPLYVISLAQGTSDA